VLTQCVDDTATAEEPCDGLTNSDVSDDAKADVSEGALSSQARHACVCEVENDDQGAIFKPGLYDRRSAINKACTKLVVELLL